jgi:hypothetical protein
LISTYVGWVAVYYEGKYYNRFYKQRTNFGLKFELMPRPSAPSKAKVYYFRNIKKVGITFAPLIFGDYFNSAYSRDVSKKLVGYIDIDSDLFASIRIYFPFRENMEITTNSRNYSVPLKYNKSGWKKNYSYRKYWRLNRIQQY